MLSTDVESLRLFVDSTFSPSSSSSGASTSTANYNNTSSTSDTTTMMTSNAQISPSSAPVLADASGVENIANLMFTNNNNNNNSSSSNMSNNNEDDEGVVNTTTDNNNNTASLTTSKNSNSKSSTIRDQQLFFEMNTPRGELNLTATSAIKTTVGWVTVHSTRGFRSGTHEWSIHIENQGETNDVSGLMVGLLPKNTFSRFDGFISQGGGWCLSRGGKFYGQWKRVDVFNQQQQQSPTAPANANQQQHGIVFGTGDVVHLLLDFEMGRLAVRVGEREVIGEFTQSVPPGTVLVPAVSLHYRQQHVRLGNHRSYSKRELNSPWREKLLNSTPACAFDLPFYVARELPFIHPLTHMEAFSPSNNHNNTSTSSISFPGERETALRIAIVKRACEAARNLMMLSSNNNTSSSIDNINSSSSIYSNNQPTISALWRGQVARRKAESINNNSSSSNNSSNFTATASAVIISNTLSLLCKTLQQQQKNSVSFQVAANQLAQLCNSVCDALAMNSTNNSTFNPLLRADASFASSSSSNNNSIGEMQQEDSSSLISPQLLDEVVTSLKLFLDSSFASSGGLEEKNESDDQLLSDKENETSESKSTTGNKLSSNTTTPTPRSQTANFLKKLNQQRQKTDDEEEQQNNSSSSQNKNQTSGLASSARVVSSSSGANVGFSVTDTTNNNQQHTSVTTPKKASSLLSKSATNNFSSTSKKTTTVTTTTPQNTSTSAPATSSHHQEVNPHQTPQSSNNNNNSSSSYFEFSSPISSIFELLLSISLHRGRVADVLSLVRFLLNSNHSVDDAKLKLKMPSNSSNNSNSNKKKSGIYNQLDSLLDGIKENSRVNEQQRSFFEKKIVHLGSFYQSLFGSKRNIISSGSIIPARQQAFILRAEQNLLLSSSSKTKPSSTTKHHNTIISFTSFENFLFIHHTDGITKLDVNKLSSSSSSNNNNSETDMSSSSNKNTNNSSSSRYISKLLASSSNLPSAIAASTNLPTDLVGTSSLSKWSSCAISTSGFASRGKECIMKNNPGNNDDDDTDNTNNNNSRTPQHQSQESRRVFVLYTDQCVARDIAFIIYDFDTLSVLKIVNTSSIPRWNPFVKLISPNHKVTKRSNNNTDSRRGHQQQQQIFTLEFTKSWATSSSSEEENSPSSLLRSYIDNKSAFNPVHYANDVSLFSAYHHRIQLAKTSTAKSNNANNSEQQQQNEDEENMMMNREFSAEPSFDTNNDHNNESNDNQNSDGEATGNNFLSTLTLLSETASVNSSKKSIVLGNLKLSIVNLSDLLSSTGSVEADDNNDNNKTTAAPPVVVLALEPCSSLSLPRITSSSFGSSCSPLSLSSPTAFVQFPLLQKAVQLSSSLAVSYNNNSNIVTSTNNHHQQHQQQFITQSTSYGNNNLHHLFTRPSQCTVELWISLTRSAILNLINNNNNISSSEATATNNHSASSCLIYQCGDRSNPSIGEVFLELCVQSADEGLPSLRGGFRFDTTTSAKTAGKADQSSTTTTITNGTILSCVLPENILHSTSPSSSWFHVALVCDGTSPSSSSAWSLYLDGTVVCFSPMTTSQEQTKAPSGELFPYFSAAALTRNSGNNNNNNVMNRSTVASSIKSSTWTLGSCGGFGSSMTELRVWLGARSRNEILSNMRSPLIDELSKAVSQQQNQQKTSTSSSSSTSNINKQQQQISALSSLSYDSLILYCPLVDDCEDGGVCVSDYSFYFYNLYLLNILLKSSKSSSNRSSRHTLFNENDTITQFKGWITNNHHSGGMTHRNNQTRSSHHHYPLVSSSSSISSSSSSTFLLSTASACWSLEKFLASSFIISNTNKELVCVTPSVVSDSTKKSTSVTSTTSKSGALTGTGANSGDLGQLSLITSYKLEVTNNDQEDDRHQQVFLVNKNASVISVPHPRVLFSVSSSNNESEEKLIGMATISLPSSSENKKNSSSTADNNSGNIGWKFVSSLAIPSSILESTDRSSSTEHNLLTLLNPNVISDENDDTQQVASVTSPISSLDRNDVKAVSLNLLTILSQHNDDNSSVGDSSSSYYPRAFIPLNFDLRRESLEEIISLIKDHFKKSTSTLTNSNSSTSTSPLPSNSNNSNNSPSSSRGVRALVTSTVVGNDNNNNGNNNVFSWRSEHVSPLVVISALRILFTHLKNISELEVDPAELNLVVPVSEVSKLFAVVNNSNNNNSVTPQRRTPTPPAGASPGSSKATTQQQQPPPFPSPQRNIQHTMNSSPSASPSSNNNNNNNNNNMSSLSVSSSALTMGSRIFDVLNDLLQFTSNNNNNHTNSENNNNSTATLNQLAQEALKVAIPLLFPSSAGRNKLLLDALDATEHENDHKKNKNNNPVATTVVNHANNKNPTQKVLLHRMLEHFGDISKLSSFGSSADDSSSSSSNNDRLLLSRLVDFFTNMMRQCFAVDNSSSRSSDESATSRSGSDELITTISQSISTISCLQLSLLSAYSPIHSRSNNSRSSSSKDPFSHSSRTFLEQGILHPEALMTSCSSSSSSNSSNSSSSSSISEYLTILQKTVDDLLSLVSSLVKNSSSVATTIQNNNNVGNQQQQQRLLHMLSQIFTRFFNAVVFPAISSISANNSLNDDSLQGNVKFFIDLPKKVEAELGTNENHANNKAPSNTFVSSSSNHSQLALSVNSLKSSVQSSVAFCADEALRGLAVLTTRKMLTTTNTNASSKVHLQPSSALPSCPSELSLRLCEDSKPDQQKETFIKAVNGDSSIWGSSSSSSNSHNSSTNPTTETAYKSFVSAACYLYYYNSSSSSSSSSTMLTQTNIKTASSSKEAIRETLLRNLTSLSGEFKTSFVTRCGIIMSQMENATSAMKRLMEEMKVLVTNFELDRQESSASSSSSSSSLSISRICSLILSAMNQSNNNKNKDYAGKPFTSWMNVVKKMNTELSNQANGLHQLSEIASSSSSSPRLVCLSLWCRAVPFLERNITRISGGGNSTSSSLPKPTKAVCAMKAEAEQKLLDTAILLCYGASASPLSPLSASSNSSFASATASSSSNSNNNNNKYLLCEILNHTVSYSPIEKLISGEIAHRLVDMISLKEHFFASSSSSASISSPTTTATATAPPAASSSGNTHHYFPQQINHQDEFRETTTSTKIKARRQSKRDRRTKRHREISVFPETYSFDLFTRDSLREETLAKSWTILRKLMTQRCTDCITMNSNQNSNSHQALSSSESSSSSSSALSLQQRQGYELMNSIISAIEKEIDFTLSEIKTLDFLDAVGEHLEALLTLLCTMLQSLPVVSQATMNNASLCCPPSLMRIICKLAHRLLHKPSSLASVTTAGSALSIAEITIHLIRHTFMRGMLDLEQTDKFYASLFPAGHFEKKSSSTHPHQTSFESRNSAINNFLSGGPPGSSSSSSTSTAASILDSAFRNAPSSILRTIFEVAIGTSHVSSHEPICGSCSSSARRLLTCLISIAPKKSLLADTLISSIKSILEIASCRLATDESGNNNNASSSPRPDSIYLLWTALSSIFGPISDSPRIGEVMRRSKATASTLPALQPSSPLPGPADRSAFVSGGTKSEIVVVADANPVTASSIAMILRASSLASAIGASGSSSSSMAANSTVSGASDMAQVISLESLLLLSNNNNNSNDNNSDDESVAMTSSEQQSNQPTIHTRTDSLLSLGPKLAPSTMSSLAAAASSSSSPMSNKTSAKNQYQLLLDLSYGGTSPSFVQSELTQVVLDTACLLCRIPISFATSASSATSSSSSNASKIALSGWTCSAAATATRALSILLSFPEVVSSQLLLPKNSASKTPSSSSSPKQQLLLWNDNKIKLRCLYDTLCTKRVSDGSPLWVIEEQSSVLLTSLVFSPAFRTSLLLDSAASAVASVASLSPGAALLASVEQHQQSRSPLVSSQQQQSPTRNNASSTTSSNTTSTTTPSQPSSSTSDQNIRFNGEMLSALAKSLPPDSTIFSRSSAVVSSSVSGCSVYSASQNNHGADGGRGAAAHHSLLHHSIFGSNSVSSGASSAFPANHHLVFRHPSASIKCAPLFGSDSTSNEKDAKSSTTNTTSKKTLSLLPSSSLTVEMVVCVPDVTKLTLGTATSASCSTSIASRALTAPSAVTAPVFAASPFQLLTITENKHNNILLSVTLEGANRKLIIKRSVNPYVDTTSKSKKKNKKSTRNTTKDENDNNEDEDEDETIVTLIIPLDHREIGRWMRLAIVYDANVDALLAYGDGLLLGTASICGRMMQQQKQKYHQQRYQNANNHQNSPLHHLHMQYQQLHHQFASSSSAASNTSKYRKSHRQQHDDDDDDEDRYNANTHHQDNNNNDEEDVVNQRSDDDDDNEDDDNQQQLPSFEPVPLSITIGNNNNNTTSTTNDQQNNNKSSPSVDPDFLISLGGLRVWPHSISGHKLKFSADDPLAESPLAVFRFSEGSGSTTASEILPPSIMEEDPPTSSTTPLLGELKGSVFWMPTDSKQWAQETDTRTPEEIWSTSPNQLLALLQNNNSNPSSALNTANNPNLLLPGGNGSTLPESEMSSDGAGNCAVRREWLGRAMSSDAASLGLSLVNAMATLSGHYARSVFLSLMDSLSSPVFPVVLSHCCASSNAASKNGKSTAVSSILGQNLLSTNSSSSNTSSSSHQTTTSAPIPLLELLASLSPDFSPRKQQQHNEQLMKTNTNLQDNTSNHQSQDLETVSATAAQALSSLPNVAFNLVRYIAHKSTDGVTGRADDPMTTPTAFMRRSPLQVIDDTTRKVTTTSLILIRDSKNSSRKDANNKNSATKKSTATTAASSSSSPISSNSTKEDEAVPPLFNSLVHTFVVDIVDACAPEFEARAVDISAGSSSTATAAHSLLLGGSASSATSADSGAGWVVPLIAAGQTNTTFVISLEGANHLDQLQIFQDRALKTQIAKFPDSHGSWTEVEYLCGSWLFIRAANNNSGGSALPVTTNAKAIIKTRTQRCFVALRMLDSILSLGLSFSSSAAAASSGFLYPLVKNLCNAPVLLSLLSLCHVEAGSHRALFSRVIVGLLKLWAKHPQVNPHDRIPLGLLFDRMNANSSILFRREEMSSAQPGSSAMRFAQHITEILLTAAQTEEAWFSVNNSNNNTNNNNNLITISQKRWNESAKIYSNSLNHSMKSNTVALEQLRKLFHLSSLSVSRLDQIEQKKKILVDLFGTTSSHNVSTTNQQQQNSSPTSRSPFSRDRFLSSSSSSLTSHSAISPSATDFLLNSNLVDLETIPSSSSSASQASSASLSSSSSLFRRRYRRGSIICSSERGIGCFRSSTGYSSGQWYFEVKIPQSFSNVAIAIVLNTFKLPPGFASGDGNNSTNSSASQLGTTLPFGQATDGGQSWCFDGSRLCRWHNGVRSDFAFRAKWKARDVIGILLDIDSGTLSCLHNGKSSGAAFDNLKAVAATATALQQQKQQNSSEDTSNNNKNNNNTTTGVYFHAAVSFAQGGCEVNFGGAPFVCGPPSSLTASSSHVASDVLYGGSHTPSSATSSFLPFDPVSLKRGLHHTPPMMAGQLLISLAKEFRFLMQQKKNQQQKQPSSTSAPAAVSSSTLSSPRSSTTTPTLEWLLKTASQSASSYNSHLKKQEAEQQKQKAQQQQNDEIVKKKSNTLNTTVFNSFCSPLTEGRSGDEEIPLVVLEGRARVDSELMSFSSPTFGCARSLGHVTTIAGHVRIASKGKWYHEIHVQGEGLVLIGWATQGFSPDAARSRSIGDDLHSWGIDGCRMLARHNRQQRSLGRHPWRDGDVIGSLVDCDAGTIHFSVNGIALRDVSDPPQLPSLSSSPADSMFGGSEKSALFSRVPTWLGLFPVVTVEPETSVSFAFNRDEMVYCPPDANPLGCAETFCAAVENQFSSATVVVDTNNNDNSSENIINIEDAETKELITLLQQENYDFVSTIRRLSDKIGSHVDPDFTRPINWRRVCTDVANETSRSPQLIQTVAIFLMRITRLAAFAQKFCPHDIDCIQHTTPNSGDGGLQQCLQALYNYNLVLSSGTCSLHVGNFFKRTNGLLDPLNINAPIPNNTLPVQNTKLSLSRRRANMLPSGSQFTDSILGQVFSLLQDKSPGLFLSGKRLWTVSFVGEGADDAGGPYRESIGSICQEVHSSPNSSSSSRHHQDDGNNSNNNNSSSPLLFIPSQNQEMNLGEVRDKFVLDCAGFRRSREVLLPLAYFFGQLIGGCLRSGELLPLSLPSTVWKFLVGTHTTSATLNPLTNSTAMMMSHLTSQDFEEDMSQIDSGIVSTIQFLSDSSSLSSSSSSSSTPTMDITDLYDGSFVAVDSSGVEVPLFPSGEHIPVSSWSSMPLLLHLWKKFRLLDESMEAILTLTRGFHSIVPPAMLRGVRWSHLERAICGRSDFSVTDMENSARYEGLSKSDNRVVWFWQALRSWTPQDRSAFARFISGRERLATVPKLKLLPAVAPEDCPSEDELLPHASTCFIWLSLPNYSCYEVLAEKLLYAVRHCVDIDADFRVRDGEEEGDVEQQGPRLLRARPTDDGEFEDYSHLL